MTFGNILKKLRQDYNMTQDELARKIDTSRSNIANYENGKNMPSVDILEKIANLFGVSTDFLLGKSDIRNPEKVDLDKLQIGLSTKDYANISDTQIKQIEDFAKFVLKDNKKDKEDK